MSGHSPRSRLRSQILGSDLVGPVGLRLGNILRRLEWGVIPIDSNGAVSVPRSEPDLNCSGLESRDRGPCAMAVDEAFEFGEERQQVFVGIHVRLLDLQDAEPAGPRFSRHLV